MRNAFERIFFTIAISTLVFNFPWLAFFPIIACLAHEENK